MCSTMLFASIRASVHVSFTARLAASAGARALLFVRPHSRFARRLRRRARTGRSCGDGGEVARCRRSADGARPASRAGCSRKSRRRHPGRRGRAASAAARVLIGGLTPPTCRPTRSSPRPGRLARVGRIPAATARLGGRHASARTTYSSAAATASRSSTTILAVDPRTGAAQVGRAPAAPSSDQAGGGHRPHGVHRRRLHGHALARHDRRLEPRRARARRRAPAARAVATPPSRRLRGRLVIAGGSLENGTASDAVLRVRPRRRQRDPRSAGCPRRRRTPPQRRSAASPS